MSLKSVASLLASVVAIGGYFIQKRKEVVIWYKGWRKGRYEDKVDKVNASRDSKSMGKFVRDILKKRYKRHKTS